jgi:hypothetical protein
VAWKKYFEAHTDTEIREVVAAYRVVNEAAERPTAKYLVCKVGTNGMDAKDTTDTGRGYALVPIGATEFPDLDPKTRSLLEEVNYIECRILISSIEI